MLIIRKPEMIPPRNGVDLQQGSRTEEVNRLHSRMATNVDLDVRERGLDNTLSETFPCSDPLSSIPNPGSHLFDGGR